MPSRALPPRRYVAALLSGACLAAAAPASATPPLHTPWPCDVSYTISQGHNTGSHTAEGSWAWDVGIPVGDEVAAPADGVVRLVRMDSTTGGCSSTYANDANYVVLDFGDGTEALFLHLQAGSSSLQVGQTVNQGDVVGRVGLTGWVCGAHLHFQIQQTCGSWWCQSIQSSFLDFGDPGYGVSVQSNNCPLLADCDAVGDGVTVIDERTTCYSRETSAWWSAGEGFDDHHFFTYAIDELEPESTGKWTFDVSLEGTYQLDVFIPDTEAGTTNASYQLDTGTELLTLGPVDQATDKGWVSLAEVSLAEGSGRSLLLADNTGEAVGAMIPIAHDAIRFTRLDSPSTGGSGGGGAVGGSDVGGDPGGTGGAGTGATGADSSSSGMADVSGGEAEAGCACRAGASPLDDRWAVLWLALGGALLGRRRRR